MAETGKKFLPNNEEESSGEKKGKEKEEIKSGF